MRYNLLHEPWIEVIDLNNQSKHLSLTEVLVSAHELRDVHTLHVTERTALIRVLLAFLHRAFDGPPDDEAWLEMWEKGRFSSSVIADYADRWEDRFDLFHEKTPFFQIAGLDTNSSDGWKPWRDLVIDAATKGRPLFSSRHGVAQETRTPAEAALWLIHTQAYDTGAIKTPAIGDPHSKGGRSYGNTAGWQGYLSNILVGGQTLFQTLILNLIPRSTETGTDVALSSPSDLPAWEKAETFTADTLRNSIIEPTGPVDLFTWQSRRLLLRLDDDGLIRYALRCAGPRLECWNSHLWESHSTWDYSENQTKKQRNGTVYRPTQVDPSVQPWRGLAALMPHANTSKKGQIVPKPAVTQWLAGISTDAGLSELVALDRSGMVYSDEKFSSLTREVGSRIAVPTAILSVRDKGLQEMVGTALTRIARMADGAGTLAYTVALAQSPMAAETKERARAASQRAGSRVYAELDSSVRAWLAGLVGLTTEEELSDAERAIAAKSREVAMRIGEDIMHKAGHGAWRPSTQKNKKPDLSRAWGRFCAAARTAEQGDIDPDAATEPEEADDDD